MLASGYGALTYNNTDERTDGHDLFRTVAIAYVFGHG